MLTDFSPFKPVHVPFDDAATQFGLFFEGAGRRDRCYLAPERLARAESPTEAGVRDLQRMDVFSLGCVLAELYTGKAVLHLPALLANAANPLPAERVPGEGPLRDLVLEMTSACPTERRLSAAYLRDLGRLVPEAFLSVLLPLSFLFFSHWHLIKPRTKSSLFKILIFI